MPFVIHPRIRKGLGRLAAMTAFGVLASTGVAAAASCPTVSTSAPLTQFGDTNSYFVAPGGSFEGASLPVGSVATGASLTPGNEPWHVLGGSDNQSLTVQSGGSITLPYTCIDSTVRDLRFFAHQVTPGSSLKVTVLVDMFGRHFSVPLARLADGSMNDWGLTDPIYAPERLTLMRGFIAQAALKFSVTDGGGAWQIDDVLIDPYSFG